MNGFRSTCSLRDWSESQVLPRNWLVLRCHIISNQWRQCQSYAIRGHWLQGAKSPWWWVTIGGSMVPWKTIRRIVGWHVSPYLTRPNRTVLPLSQKIQWRGSVVGIDAHQIIDGHHPLRNVSINTIAIVSLFITGGCHRYSLIRSFNWQLFAIQWHDYSLLTINHYSLLTINQLTLKHSQ